METGALSEAIDLLLANCKNEARQLIAEKYPFKPVKTQSRSYSEKEKMQIFMKDGFVDRYSGKRLVNPGVLKSITYFFPEDFPYHPHWKMSQCHKAYWDLLPTIDHIVPIARGGADAPENWVTTSMLNNSIKSNWTLEELRWNICAAGNLTEWDGLTGKFIQLVEAEPDILSDAYIRRWYSVSKRSLYMPVPAAEKSFYCPLYNGKITQYDCDEFCCCVKTGYLPNDGLPYLMELSDINRKRESCINCSRNEA